MRSYKRQTPYLVSQEASKKVDIDTGSCMVLSGDESKTMHTCVCAVGDDPGTCCSGSFQQPLAEHTLQFGLYVKVQKTTVHSDQQLGKVKAPVLCHHLNHGLRPRV